MSTKEMDDLLPEQIPGFKVGEKKTIEEYTKLDAEDESLAKWKASLGLSSTSNLLPVSPNDKRKVVILEMALLVENRDPIIISLEKESELSLKDKKISFNIKEKSIYSLRIKFKIQHEIVTGLKYLQGVKKSGIRVDKLEEPCGSYAPNTVDKPYYEITFPENEAPSGMLARGSYSAVSKFVDDDMNVHLVLPWSFQITKQ
ncbi:hypothetical protein PACTADRAFT_51584 [Pachysolen tannophilus NRRL Y-2460]|uniref:Rho GDP-dissociation inhibitor n=1 Tax=Pachysolen tannophilus NRRL Y-2460 TaxID=669874 RepID=A0A1E4TPZ7_PACTA|nr:hypothetical protein PACTADRAFT_51584 [Pachysolen tannophilus NRRL Y-2460]